MSQPAFTTQPSGPAFVNHAGMEVRPQPIGSESQEMNETPGRPAPSDLGVGEKNLGLLLDVELNVLLRFGQRTLTLREVLDLKCGSVIELDRRVDDPVELLLDGRVIARGNAAIVDGNYGLQVTEVLQPSVPTRAAECVKEQWK